MEIYMNIIIIGCGRFGSTLANELSDAGHNISVIDRDNERLNVLGSGFNGLKIKGIEYDNEVLKEAGIQAADSVLSVTPDENINITVSLIAKEIYKVPQIIARIVNPNRQNIYEELDIKTINPIQLGVDILKEGLSLNKTGTVAVINKDYEVAEVIIGKDKRFTVKELEEKYSCVISAIINEEKLIFPSKDEFIKPGERIICTIDKKNLKRLISVI
jgi:trk system potassium uptake protein TrkA